MKLGSVKVWADAPQPGGSLTHRHCQTLFSFYKGLWEKAGDSRQVGLD